MIVDFIKATVTLFLTTIFSIIVIFCMGAAVGFWFKFAHLGFTIATQLMNNYL